MVSRFTSWSHCISEVRPSGEDVGFRARGLDVHAQASAGPQSPLATQGQAAPSAGTRDLGAIRRRDSLCGAHFLHSIVARGCPTPRNRPPTTCRWGVGRGWQPGATKPHPEHGLDFLSPPRCWLLERGLAWFPSKRFSGAQTWPCRRPEAGDSSSSHKLPDVPANNVASSSALLPLKLPPAAAQCRLLLTGSPGRVVAARPVSTSI